MTLDDDGLARCEERLGHAFRDRGHLVEALTHASARSEEQPCNERLEFLGDSLLGFFVSDCLFALARDWSEGELTRARARLVSRAGLLRVAKALGLEDFVIVGRTFRDRNDIRDSILANAVEALIAAVYRDAGVRAARTFVNRHFGAALREIARHRPEPDPKSRLGERVQAIDGSTPVYVVEEIEGPDHEQVFTVSVKIHGRVVATAQGTSKRAAQRAAAQRALEALAEEEQG
ncbi:MAG: ribonuclease III [Planctomycetota bacterium]